MSSITERAHKCICTIEDLSRRAGDEQTFSGLQASLQDSLGRLRLWTRSYGYDTSAALGAFEDRFNNEPQLSDHFVKLLEDLEDELRRGK